MSLSETKRGFRWWFFNRFGPPEVRNLIDHIDKITEDGQFDIAIYPMGKFPFHIKLSVGEQPDPFVFATAQERYTFQIGLNYGLQVMGGEAQILSEEDYESIEQMEKKATHGGGSGRNN